MQIVRLIAFILRVDNQNNFIELFFTKVVCYHQYDDQLKNGCSFLLDSLQNTNIS